MNDGLKKLKKEQKKNTEEVHVAVTVCWSAASTSSSHRTLKEKRRAQWDSDWRRILPLISNGKKNVIIFNALYILTTIVLFKGLY